MATNNKERNIFKHLSLEKNKEKERLIWDFTELSTTKCCSIG
jgi:hypothetical protein